MVLARDEWANLSSYTTRSMTHPLTDPTSLLPLYVCNDFGKCVSTRVYREQ